MRFFSLWVACALMMPHSYAVDTCIGDLTLVVTSEGWQSSTNPGSASVEVSYAGITYPPYDDSWMGIGFNVVVLDGFTYEVISQQNFDTYNLPTASASMVSYLDGIAEKNLVVITAMDATTYWSGDSRISDALKNKVSDLLGATQFSNLGTLSTFRDSYILVSTKDSGGGTSPLTERYTGSTTLKTQSISLACNTRSPTQMPVPEPTADICAQGFRFDLKSSGYFDGDEATLKVLVDNIGDTNYDDSWMGRGFNVVVFNAQNNNVVKQQNFDTYGDLFGVATQDMINFLTGLNTNRLVIILVNDAVEWYESGHSHYPHLTSAFKDFMLSQYGADLSFYDASKYRDSYIYVGKRLDPNGPLLEMRKGASQGAATATLSAGCPTPSPTPAPSHVPTPEPSPVPTSEPTSCPDFVTVSGAVKIQGFIHNVSVVDSSTGELDDYDDARTDAEGDVADPLDGTTYDIRKRNFGSAVAGMGDIDGDGTNDLAVGAQNDGRIKANTGAVFILFLDSSGKVKSSQKIVSGIDSPGTFDRGVDPNYGGTPFMLYQGDRFGCSLANLGTTNAFNAILGPSFGTQPVIAIGAYGDDGRASPSVPDSGAVYIYFLSTEGRITFGSKIAVDYQLNDVADPINIATNYHFGASVASLGDIDGDGTMDLAVGAPGANSGGGLVYVITDLANLAAGTPLSVTLIGDYSSEDISACSGYKCGLGNFTLNENDWFGTSVSKLTPEAGLVIGADGDSDGGADTGAVYLIANLGQADYLVRKISNSEGNPLGVLDQLSGMTTFSLAAEDRFGSSVATMDNDFNGDGASDIAVGAMQDPTYAGELFPSGRNGAVYIFTLWPDRVGYNTLLTIKSASKIYPKREDTVPYSQQLWRNVVQNGKFGNAVSAIGDLDGDGSEELAVGAFLAEGRNTIDQAKRSGAVYIVSLAHDSSCAPTAEPTLEPTPEPTREPTPEPTRSLEPTRSFAPTPVPTPVPSHSICDGGVRFYLTSKGYNVGNSASLSIEDAATGDLNYDDSWFSTGFNVVVYDTAARMVRKQGSFNIYQDPFNSVAMLDFLTPCYAGGTGVCVREDDLVLIMVKDAFDYWDPNNSHLSDDLKNLLLNEYGADLTMSSLDFRDSFVYAGYPGSDNRKVDPKTEGPCPFCQKAQYVPDNSNSEFAYVIFDDGCAAGTYPTFEPAASPTVEPVCAGGVRFEMYSADYDNGNAATLDIISATNGDRNFDDSWTATGFNVVIYNPHTETEISHANFNTYASTTAAQDMIDYLTGVNSDYLVIVLAKDAIEWWGTNNGYPHVTTALKSFMSSNYGASLSFVNYQTFRSSYVFAGKNGGPKNAEEVNLSGPAMAAFEASCI